MTNLKLIWSFDESVGFFCSTSKPLISSYLGINAVYRNSFDSLPPELIVIAHDNDQLSGDR